MAISSTIVTAGTAATALNTASSAWTKMVIRNASTDTAVALGPSGLAVASSFQLPFGESISVTLPPGDVLYARVAADTEPVHVLRMSN